jgi:ankyrin repeat/SOCS box protein 15
MLYKDASRNEKLPADPCVDFVDAAIDDDIVTVRQMLDNGMHPDSQGFKGWTALRRAAVKNNYDVAFELLKRGASVDATNYTGKTALMMACAYDNHEMATLLIVYGADPNRTSCGMRTALMIAASHGYVRVVDALLDSLPWIDLDKTDPFGKSALHMAIEYGFDKVAKMLEAAGAKRPVAGFLENGENGFPRHGVLMGGAI